MDNRTALFFLVVIGGAVGYDLGLNDSEYSLFLARKGLGLIDAMAVWR